MKKYPIGYTPKEGLTRNLIEETNGVAAFRMFHTSKGKVQVEVWTPDMNRRKEKQFANGTGNSTVVYYYELFHKYKRPAKDLEPKLIELKEDFHANLMRMSKELTKQYDLHYEKGTPKLMQPEILKPIKAKSNMATKEGLELGFEVLWDDGYCLTFHSHDDQIKVRMRDSDNKEIGDIHLDLIGKGVYEVEAAACNTKGLGKFLYYAAMSKVYPAWICCDRVGCTKAAMRLYHMFDFMDYVEKDILPKKHIVTEPRGENVLSNIMYRFKRERND